jgi:hypothetical protein
VLVHECMVGFGVLAGDADVFILAEIGMLGFCCVWKIREGMYHVESNDIFEGDFAGFVFLDEDFVDEDWTGTCWQTEDKGM